jgi:excisionase family DNA binding protein
MNNNQNVPNLLNEAEAAKLLGVSKVTLWRARKAGELKFYRVGGSKVRYAIEHLNEYLTTRERALYAPEKAFS